MIYRSSSIRVRIAWLDLQYPLIGTCECEVSRLLPQATFKFTLGVPDELDWSDPFWTFYVATDPGANCFQVWQKIEDQPWSSEFTWLAESVVSETPESTESLFDLRDALSDGDAKRAFDAFTKLRGGQVEVVGSAA